MMLYWEWLRADCEDSIECMIKIIQHLYSSVCGTDVAVFSHGPNTGHKVTVGGEFGHETISRVVKVGTNITDFVVGERVYPYPLYAKGDTKRAGTIGGFSEYILIPNARRNHSLYSVDERISDRLASLIESLTVGWMLLVQKVFWMIFCALERLRADLSLWQ